MARRTTGVAASRRRRMPHQTACKRSAMWPDSDRGGAMKRTLPITVIAEPACLCEGFDLGSLLPFESLGQTMAATRPFQLHND